MSEMPVKHRARLSDYCDVFNISVKFTENDPASALQILVHLFAMPSLNVKSERRSYGIEILENTNAAFPHRSNDPLDRAFFGKVSGIVIMMQEFPAWYTDLNRSVGELVDIYENLKTATKWMKIVGLGAGTGAIVSSAQAGLDAEGRARDRAKAMAQKLGQRAVGRGGLAESVLSKVGRGARAGGIYTGLIFVVGTAAYHSMIERMELIEDIVEIKYREGKATEEQYKRVFGNVDEIQLIRYWE